MTLREWMLLVLLAAAGGCVVQGVSLVSDAAAWVVAGFVLAGLALLVLTDVTGDGE